MDLAEKTNNSRRHPWEKARARAVLKILDHTFKGKTPRKVLDIGCGDGFMLQVLSHLIPELKADGIDVNLLPETAAKMSTANIRFSNSPNDMQGPYDLIILMDVLEHIADEPAFLKNISFFARPDTVFLITVPAYQRLFSGHDVFLKHYRRYNNTTLTNVLNQSGLTITSSGSLFSCLLLPRLLECLREKVMPCNQKTNNGVGNWEKGPFLTSLVEGVFNADNNFLLTFNKHGIRTPGLSLWATAKLKA